MAIINASIALSMTKPLPKRPTLRYGRIKHQQKRFCMHRLHLIQQLVSMLPSKVVPRVQNQREKESASQMELKRQRRKRKQKKKNQRHKRNQ
jgi:hypothetical protein